MNDGADNDDDHTSPTIISEIPPPTYSVYIIGLAVFLGHVHTVRRDQVDDSGGEFNKTV